MLEILPHTSHLFCFFEKESRLGAKKSKVILYRKEGGKFEKDDCIFQISRLLLNTYFHSILSVLGLKKYSCSPSAIKTTMLSIANPSPKLPPSVHFPNNWVTAAPANTPVIFIIPYAVPLYFAETNWHNIGMLLASKIPKPIPNNSPAPITLMKP